MRTNVDIHKTKENFSVTVKQKNACKLEFSDHLWLPFLDQPQSEIAVSVTMNFKIYNILAAKKKHGIGPNNIIT